VGAVRQFRDHVRVLRLLRVPTYACRLVRARSRRLERKTVFLVRQYRTAVKVADRAASVVRVGCVAIRYGVPAQTGDAGVDAVYHRFHRAVAVQVKEQQVVDVQVGARAQVRGRDAQVGRSLAQVVAVDRRVVPVRVIPQQRIVRRQVAYFNRAGRAVYDRILRVDHFDDLFVFVAVGVSIQNVE
jgi:hypothetical protein